MRVASPPVISSDSTVWSRLELVWFSWNASGSPENHAQGQPCRLPVILQNRRPNGHPPTICAFNTRCGHTPWAVITSYPPTIRAFNTRCGHTPWAVVTSDPPTIRAFNTRCAHTPWAVITSDPPTIRAFNTRYGHTPWAVITSDPPAVVSAVLLEPVRYRCDSSHSPAWDAPASGRACRDGDPS
eukprot:354688-Chlamydomonas_euryale.AAC.3